MSLRLFFSFFICVSHIRPTLPIDVELQKVFFFISTRVSLGFAYPCLFYWCIMYHSFQVSTGYLLGAIYLIYGIHALATMASATMTMIRDSRPGWTVVMESTLCVQIAC